MSSYASVRYEELVCNPTLFWDTLLPVLESTITKLRFPVMKGEKLDLHRLFIEVTCRGGMEEVIKDRKWTEVLRAISVAGAQRTNGSFYLREYYLKFLYEFEQLYFLEKPVPSSQSKGNDELQVGNVASSSQCRDKKKAKLAVVDSADPECFRINLKTDIGLYYFFAEQDDKLRPDFNGHGRTLLLEIKRMWSNLTESEKQLQPTWINKKMSTNAPVRYAELVSNPSYFWDKLLPFLGLARTTLKIPVMKGKKLDLHRLFIEVTSRGGMEKVTKDQQWTEVSRAFNFPATLTNGSFRLKNNYIKFLYQFELTYFLGNPVPSIQSTAAGTTDESHVGKEVEGVIDGKIDNVYLVTVKIGSEEMRGVLYEVPETPRQPEQTMETPPADVASSSQCRDKKKAKMVVADSQEPKCLGINLRTDIGQYYFFAEQYDRLKPGFNGEERTLMREIERMWSNLTESEKQVYKQREGKTLKYVKS